VLDLVAAVLAAGAPVTTALDLVAEALREYAPAQAEHLADLARRQALALPRPSSAGPAWLGVLERTLLLAGDAGVPPGAVLVSAAADERRRRAERRRLAAARLGVQVVLPTGLCLLPAFALLTVVPMVVALLGIP
jgi:pilus assembly protein TadC